jgi:hypothetical protein
MEELIRREAARLAGQLARSMRRAKLDTIYPGSGPFNSVTARGSRDEVSCMWRSNLASVSPSANLSAASAFIDLYPALIRESSARVRIMENAEQWSPYLARRMAAAGITSIECPRKSHLARVAVRSGEVVCTWKSNGVTVPATGNASVAESFVALLGHLDATVKKQEQRLRATLNKGRSVA